MTDFQEENKYLPGEEKNFFVSFIVEMFVVILALFMFFIVMNIDTPYSFSFLARRAISDIVPFVVGVGITSLILSFIACFPSVLCGEVQRRGEIPRRAIYMFRFLLPMSAIFLFL